MGYKSPHRQQQEANYWLAKGLAEVGKNKPEESSPYGARPSGPALGPKRLIPKDLGELFHDDYVAPVAQAVHFARKTIQEHPAESAAGLAAGLTLPVSAMGLLGAGALGIAGRAIDKTHPLTDEPSDYGRQTPKEMAKDFAIAGGVNALTHGLFGKWPEAVSDEALKDAVISSGLAGNRNVVPENPRYIPTEEIGGVPGYKVLNYDYIPGASANEARLAAEGVNRFVPASTLKNPGAKYFGEKMVGNPKYMMDPSTPEGKIFEERLANRDPSLDYYPGHAFAASRSELAFNPEMVVPGQDNMGKFAIGHNQGRLGSTLIDGKYYPTKWHFMADPNAALGYAHALPDRDAKMIIIDKISKGEITNANLPEGFESTDDLIKRALQSDNIRYGKDRALTKFVMGLPENEPVMQEFVPFYKNVKHYDKAGKGWATPDAADPELASLADDGNAWMYQKAQINKAKNEGHDAIMYDRSVDIGGATRKGKRTGITDVLAGFDPRLEKYPFNYGLWDLGDVRPLAAVPLAAGLGAAGYAGSQGANQ